MRYKSYDVSRRASGDIGGSYHGSTSYDYDNSIHDNSCSYNLFWHPIFKYNFLKNIKIFKKLYIFYVIQLVFSHLMIFIVSWFFIVLLVVFRVNDFSKIKTKKNKKKN